MLRVNAKIGIALVLVAGCCHGYAIEDGQATAAPSTATPTSGEQAGKVGEKGSPVLQRRNPRYKLCPSDSFDLTFPLTPEFNQTGGSTGPGAVIVQPDGYVSLLGVGD